MRIFAWDEIKSAADCIEYMTRELRMPVQGHSGEFTMFNCPFRADSDSKAFAVTRSGWFDHVEKTHGSIIDLVARAQFGGDIWRAQEHLGDYYGLEARQKSKTARKFVCAYDYTDLDGKLIHQTVRWQPKDFTQRRPDPDKPGEWIWNLKGIDPVLYRWPFWAMSPWVCIVEGEKDCDNLAALGVPCTTNAQGAEKWQDSYSVALTGKYVAILPDNDDVGRAHAQLVARAVAKCAAQVKIVNLTNLPPKGDVSDWIDAGGTRDVLLSIIKDTPGVDAETLKDPAELQVSPELSVAKKANETPFKNYEWVGENKQPIHINALIDDCHRRFWDFPRRVGSTMFDHDRKSGLIRYIENTQTLFAWIQEKSGHKVNWAKIEGAVRQEEFYSSLYYNARRYEAISGVPAWPPRDDVYYTHGSLPAPTPDARYFNEFAAHFSPATREDFRLIKAFIASPLYFRYKIARPIWVIDSIHGQGAGKTKLVEMIATLYGGDDPESSSPFWVDAKQIQNEMLADRTNKRLLSQTGRKKRIVLIDNVNGYFAPSSLCSDTTSGELSGMAPYGHGEESRPNDLTYVITVNSASLSRDLIDRSMFIHLSKPEVRQPSWEANLVAYIRAHRLQIIADIIGILERGPQFDVRPFTRFDSWEREVLAPICGTFELHSDIFKATADRRDQSDGEQEDAQLLEDTFSDKLQELGINPDLDCAFITSQVLKVWAGSGIKGLGGHTGRGAVHVIRNMVKGGMMQRLSASIDQYPHTGSHRRRGLTWNCDLRDDSDTGKSRIWVVNMKASGEIFTTPPEYISDH